MKPALKEQSIEHERFAGPNKKEPIKLLLHEGYAGFQVNVAGKTSPLRVDCLPVELLEYSRDNLDGIRSGKR
jgi:hypothetical protein